MYTIYNSREPAVSPLAEKQVKEQEVKTPFYIKKEKTSSSSIIPAEKMSTFFEAIVSSLNESLIILDCNMDLIYANEAFHIMFNLDHADVQKININYDQFRNTSSELFKKLEYLCKDDVPFENFELTYPFSNAGTRTVLISAKKICTDDSCIILVTFNDITEINISKQIGHGNISNLVENAVEGVVLVQDQKLIYANARFCKLTGLKQEPILGSSLLDFVPVEYRRMVSKKYDKCLSGKKNEQNRFEASVISTFDSDIPVDIGLSYIEYNGRPTVAVIFHDIREKLRTEEALIDSEKNFRIIFEKSPLGIVRFDQSGVITNSNEVINEMFSHASKNIIGLNVLELFPEENVQKNICQVISGTTRSFEDNIHINRNNQNFIFHGTFSSLIVDGFLQGGMGIFEDITLSVMGEHSLQVNESRLEMLLKLSQMSGESVEDIAHFTLQAAVNLTQSDIGYFVSINENDEVLIHFVLLTDEDGKYEIVEELSDYPLDINQRLEMVRSVNKYLLSNSPDKLSEKGSYGDNTKLISRHLDIPITDENGDLFILGVGNKNTPYDDLDIRNLSLLLQEMKKLVEHHEADEALRISEEKYSSLVENGNDGIIIICDDILEFTNSMFCRIVGLSAEKVKGSTFSSYLSPEYRRMVDKQISRIIDKQKNIQRTFEVVLLNRKGEQVPVKINPSIIDHQGRPAVMAIVHDITDQKQKEKELLDSLEVQNVLQTVIKNSPTIVFFWNARSGWPVEFVSENIEQFGYIPADFISGKLQYGDIIHPSDTERVHNYFARKFAEDASEYRIEYRIITRSGDFRWVVERSTPQYDEEGNLIHIQGIIMDITERKRINQFLNIESEVGNFFTPSGDLQETFDQLLEFALHIENIDSGCLYLIDKKTGDLNLSSHKGLSEDFVNNNSHYASDSMQSRYFMMGYPLYKLYSEVYPVTKRDNRVDEGLLATAIIPVKYQEEDVAVLFLASRTEFEIPYNIRSSLETVAEQMGSLIGRIETEVDMQKNQNDLKLLVDSIEDLIFVLDNEGCVLYSNDSVSNKLGYSKEEITGMNFIKMHSHNKVLEAATFFGDVLAGNRAEFKLPLVTSSGMLIPVETKLTRGKWNRQDAVISICREVNNL